MHIKEKETFGGKIGGWIVMISVIIPGMIVAGFMPDWNILPSYGWLTVSVVGAGAGCAIATKRLFLGSFCGGLVGAGAITGLTTYVDIRIYFIKSTSIYSLELLIGAIIGAVPGLLLYFLLIRRKSIKSQQQ